MTHLEQLVYEYYDWLGYLVKHNVKVGRLKKGGWEMELDIVAYNPITAHLIHIEPSIDAHSWEKRENRFKKKFAAGKKYIQNEIFQWLKTGGTIEQIAILPSRHKLRLNVAGARIITLDEFTSEVQAAVKKCGVMGKSAIPEQYPLLRTIQLLTSGYYKKI